MFFTQLLYGSYSVFNRGGLRSVVFGILALWVAISPMLAYSQHVEASAPQQSTPSTETVSSSSLLTNLVAYWKLDETSGLRLDSVGASHLSPVNTPASGAGKLGNAAYFSSAAQQGLCTPSNTALEMGNTDYTITAWAYLNTSVSDLFMLVAKDTPGGAGRDYTLLYHNYSNLNLMEFAVLNASSSGGNVNSFGFADVPNPGLQQWVFLAARYTASTKQVSLSVNGAPAITAISPITPAVSSAMLCLGKRDYASFPGHLNGRLDEVGIWKRNLSDEEVNQLYNFGEGITYPFDPVIKTMGFKSDPHWKVYDTVADLVSNTPLGNAQRVCANDNYPINCPLDATRYGHNLGYGSAWLADISGLGGANWIWAPGITGATPNADLDEYFFSQEITIPGTPVSGQITIATDDLVEIRVNNQFVGVYGSVTDINLASQAQSQVKAFNISPQLKAGTNTITFRAQNGPQTFPSCLTPCTYSQNIAGTVFLGVINYDPRLLTSSTKSISSEMAQPGQTVTYTVALRNSSVVTPAQTTLTDTLPANLNYVTDSLSATAGSASYLNGTVNWNGTIAANSAVTVTYQATVPITVARGTVITNSALIASEGDVITRTATLTIPQIKVYLPIMHRPQPGILGRVTWNGDPAGVNLQLRYFDGSSWSTWATTSTDGNGNFVFANPPTLLAGQKMYVRYLNDTNSPSRLYLWATADITAYQSGATLPIGQFDIANLNLVAPPNQTVVGLPFTFQWQPRPFTPTDSYALRMYGVVSGDDAFALSAPMGYVSGRTVNGLPPGFATYTPYGWDVFIYSPNGGVGIPYYYRLVAFSNSGNGSFGIQSEQFWQEKNPIKDWVPTQLQEQ